MKKPALKKMLFQCALILLATALAACAPSVPEETLPEPDFSNIDFKASPYKHINNGGVTGDAVMPYNIDAITGATVTVEGPAVVMSIPLSMREIENRSDGLCRGVYEDETGSFIYEGLDLHYLLNEMSEGDNGIQLTGKAYGVELKNSNRATIARFTLADVEKAHADGRPILLAYGIGAVDGSAVAPFVFDAANPSAQSEGYIRALGNDDGCLKLVYDLNSYGGNDDYTAYSNAAYIYVIEESTPGFKHTEGTPYGTSRYTDYILTFRGEGLGREMAFTLGQLEALVSYDAQGGFMEGGVGYRDAYSLANNAYWYVNEYEGLDLYKLLLYLGMEDAEKMGLAQARTTLVSFVAADGVPSQESFSVDTLSYPDAFGFYNKNAADMNDGAYKPTNADLVDTGYPVLLAYGVNGYPYTIQKGDEGYLSGLSNSGGPVRVVFGKTQYNHANGSNQVQYLKDVIVGEERLYNTHKYTDNAAQAALASDTLAIRVNGEDGNTLIDRVMAVGEVEDILYGEDVAPAIKKAAQVKDSYQANKNGSYYTDIYEGVNLCHFLMETLGLPGTNGTVTFSNGTDELQVSLSSLFNPGYNTELGRGGLVPILAFAKNGAPMVPGKDSAGYEGEIPLYPLLASEPGSYTVKNDGGPLAILLPSADPDACDAKTMLHVTSITVELVPDAYAHIRAPYDAHASAAVRLYGEGLENEAIYTAGDIESRQTKVKTLDFSVLDDTGTLTQQRYRGIGIYELLIETGVKSNAGDVTVHAADGTSTVFSLSQMKKQNYENYAAPEKAALFAMLAYGVGAADGDTMDGLPLVPADSDVGFDAAMDNDGGPLMLIMPQENTDSVNAPLCVKNVVAIEVSANEIDTWGHRMSDVYSEFLDYEFTLTVKNDDSEWSHVFTLGQLESLDDLIVRENYTVLDLGMCEGLDIWKLIQRFAADMPGIQDPVAVTVYASDGYKNDLLSVFYKSGLELGVENENGDRKPLILAYALNGCPLVDEESHEGYTGMAGNTAGPLRVVAETNQGASVKYVNKLVVTIGGSGDLGAYANSAALDALE